MSLLSLMPADYADAHEAARAGCLAAALPLEQARQALAQVAGGHTRGKVVLQIRP